MWKNIREFYSPWLDVITFGIMFSMILYVLLSYGNLPEEIPIHFNMAGEADGWGHKGTLFGLIILNFHAIFLCFILNYFLIVKSDNNAESLHLINIPFVKKEDLTEEQVRVVKKYTARMLALTNLLVSIMFGTIYYDIIQMGLGNESEGAFRLEIILILIFVPFSYYMWKMYHEIKRKPFRNNS